MTTYFTSDLHFGHKNILKFNPETRPYADVDEMDQDIISHWQKTVEWDDTVYILGDVSFRKLPETLRIMDRLPGRKILIAGNHDSKALKDAEYRAKFDAVHEYLKVEIDKKKLVLFHFPIYEWDRMHHGAYHLHGHVHGHPTGVPGRILDVGWDAHGRILSLEDVSRILEKKPVRAHGDGEDNY